MIRRLRKGQRPDALANQQRIERGRNWGRLVYLGLLVGLAGAALNYLYGDFVFLRADGLVLRDKTSIAATYIAQVKAVDVKEGQAIVKGQPLLRLQSSQMLERLADLSADRARLTAKVAEFRVRAETVTKLLPLANRREIESAKVLQRFDRLSQQQLITNVRYDQALRARLEAQQSVVRLITENKSLAEELRTLDAARADADAALEDLRRLYGNGNVTAPVNGSIGATVPSPGDVYRPGESILALYSGDAYVLAYLPERYLFAIRPGMRVRVTGGRQSAVGVIGKILPLTDALPREFQNTFKPRDRSQLARIRFDDAPPFPLHQKVSVTRLYFDD